MERVFPLLAGVRSIALSAGERRNQIRAISSVGSEQQTHNLLVPGSNPGLPTLKGEVKVEDELKLIEQLIWQEVEMEHNDLDYQMYIVERTKKENTNDLL